jgi:hypothetical protein
MGDFPSSAPFKIHSVRRTGDQLTERPRALIVSRRTRDPLRARLCYPQWLGTVRKPSCNPYHHTFPPTSTPFLTAVLNGHILIASVFHTPLFVYTSSAANLLTSSSDSAVISIILPVISGNSPASGCFDSVAPPIKIFPDASLGLTSVRCSGRTERRLECAFGWSGSRTSHSFWDGEGCAVEDDILRCIHV